MAKPPLSEPQLAWFAGILEGEGSITIRGNSVVIKIGMTDKDIIDRVHNLWNFGNRAVYERAGRKCMYVWRAQDKEGTTLILNEVLPWLGIRRSEKAKEALNFLEKNLGRSQDRKYCRKGHEYTTENTMITKLNRRRCKACNNAYSLKWYYEGKLNAK
jgi:hypothetical protein